MSKDAKRSEVTGMSDGEGKDEQEGNATLDHDLDHNFAVEAGGISRGSSQGTC